MNQPKHRKKKETEQKHRESQGDEKHRAKTYKEPEKNDLKGKKTETEIEGNKEALFNQSPAPPNHRPQQ
jgi:hypothetical protein